MNVGRAVFKIESRCKDNCYNVQHIIRKCHCNALLCFECLINLLNDSIKNCKPMICPVQYCGGAFCLDDISFAYIRSKEEKNALKGVLSKRKNHEIHLQIDNLIARSEETQKEAKRIRNRPPLFNLRSSQTYEDDSSQKSFKLQHSPDEVEEIEDFDDDEQ